MPKKTKKQKILAELRRKLMAVSTTTTPSLKNQVGFVKRQNVPAQPTAPSAPASTFVYGKESVVKPQITSMSPNYSYIIHDLIKITIFTLLALIFQGVLYFLLYRK